MVRRKSSGGFLCCSHRARQNPSRARSSTRPVRLRLERLEERALLAGDLYVTRITPQGPSGHPFDRLDIQFSKPVQDSSFTLNQISISGPGGPITPSPGALSPVGSTPTGEYQLDLTGLTGLATYSLSIGPDILDADGLAMNQNHNGTPGEPDADAWQGKLIADGVALAAENHDYDRQSLVIYGSTATIDGPHAFSSVEVLGGAAVTHSAATTDAEFRIDWTVTDALWIDATSRIDVSGRGYLPGRTIGNSTSGAATQSASGSYGGLGNSNWTWGGVTNSVYGDYRDPNELGSGGGPEQWGASGGGLVRIAASAASIDGSILATGNPLGSGGAILLAIPTLQGNGTIAADGGDGRTVWDAGGGGGRIALYYDSLTGPIASNVTARGGIGGGQMGNGSPGTVYRTTAGGQGVLQIDCGDRSVPAGLWTPLGVATDTAFAVDRLEVSGSGVVVAPEHEMPILARSVALQNGAVLTHRAATTTEEYSLRMTVAATLTIDATSKIDVSGRGYLPGRTLGNTTTGASTGSGSYGGMAYPGNTTNRVYGDYRNPNELGSGSGSGGSATLGAGGGLAHIAASAAEVDGAILANGGSSGGMFAEGGSGGGIRLDVGTLAGNGVVSANGGAGGGGGGRIAVYFEDMSGFSSSRVTAHAGADSQQAHAGAVGTVYLKPLGAEETLYLDSHGTPAGPEVWTPLGAVTDSSIAVDRLIVSGTGVVAAPEHEMPIEARDVSVLQGAMLTHQATTENQEYSLQITAARSLTVDSASRIDVSGRGYLAGRTVGNTTLGGATGNAGGSHGGVGFVASGASNDVYGDPHNPRYPGSSGGNHSGGVGGSGGGVIRIATPSAQVDGAILANGGELGSTGGSGGSLVLDAQTLSGSGNIAANGGSGGYWNGSGGGGRVAVYSQDISGFDPSRVTALGGVGNRSGSNGTVVISQLPYFTWSVDGTWFHDIETLPWTALGIDPTTLWVDVAAYGNGQAIPLAAHQPPTGSLAWDTGAVPDGRYDLVASFHDAASQVAGQAALQVTVNNSVAWHSGRIAADETWTGDRVHIVERGLIVGAGARLTIQPGTVVKFTPGGRLVVESGATLDAPATQESPIVFTSWADDSTGGDTGLDGDQALPRPGDWDGFAVASGGNLNLSTWVDVRYIQERHFGRLGASETWRASYVHHIIDEIIVPDGVTLTIHPGAVVKSDSFKGITIESGGRLIANGVVANPIVFTSVRDDSVGGDTGGDGNATSAAAGDWRGILVTGGRADLDHVELLYGGDPGGWGSSAALLAVTGSGTAALANSLIRDSLFEGILASGNGEVTAISSVITRCNRGLGADGSSSSKLVNSTLDDNLIGIWGHGGTVETTNTIISNSIEAGIDNSGRSPLAIRYSNVWSTTGVNYRDPDQTGINGNVSVDPKYADADRGNYRLDYRSPMIDAADGAAAPPTDVWGAPRYDDPRTANTGTPMPGSAAVPDMGAYEFVETAASDVDMVVASVVGPAQAVVGTRVTVQWTVTNLGTGQLTGPWHDQIVLVPSATWSVPPPLAVAEVLVGQGVTLGPGQSHSASATVRVPPGAVGDYSWGVITNTRQEVFEGENVENNSTRSLTPVALDVAQVQLGVPVSGEFSSAGEEHLYRLQLEEAQDIHLVLNRQGGIGRSELFVATGVAPTSAQYQFRAGQQGGPDVSLDISRAQAGSWYVLARATLLDTAPVAYELTVEAANFHLSQATPAVGGTGGTVTVTVEGEAIPEGATVTLVTSSLASIPALANHWIDPSRLAATFDLSGASLGPADVVVTAGAETQRLAQGFRIESGGQSDFWLEVGGPDRLRVGRPSQYTIRWGNRGNVDAPVQLVSLSASGIVRMSLDPDGEVLPSGYQFLAMDREAPVPVIPPGASESISVYVITTAMGAFSVETDYLPITDVSLSGRPIDWSAIGLAARPDSVDQETWNAFWTQLTLQVGGTWASLLPVLANDTLDNLHSSPSDPAALSYDLSLLPGLLTEFDRAEVALGWGESPVAVPQASAAPLQATTRPPKTRVLLVAAAGSSFDVSVTYSDMLLMLEYVREGMEVPRSQINVLANIGLGDRYPIVADVTPELFHWRVTELATDGQEGDTLVVYYTGHSAVDRVRLTGGAFDTSPNSGNVYYYNDFLTDLSRTKASRIVVIADTCFSGLMIDYLSTLPLTTAQRAKFTIVAATEQGIAQNSQSHPLTGSQFTYYLSRGLTNIRNGKHTDPDDGRLFVSLHDGFSAMPADIGSLMPGYWGYTPQVPAWYGQDVDLRDPVGNSKHRVEDPLRELFRPVGSGRASRNGQSQGANDPNDKTTTGVGDSAWVTPQEPLSFTIHFENIAPAGVPESELLPAAAVVVSDQLSPDLDWTTLQLVSIGFNNTVIPIDPARDWYDGTATVSTDPNPVAVSAHLDSQTGILSWQLRSYDAKTGLLPEDPLVGFLPPNDATHQGEGHMSFTIRPKAGLPTGTRILNQASIVFDVNEPILTNETLNTIDADAPTAVLAGPAPGATVKDWELNARGYLDVTFSDLGSGLNDETVLDSRAEFILSGAGAAGVAVSGEATLVEGTTNTYRYSFTGAFANGPVSVEFAAGTFADNVGNSNQATTWDFTVQFEPSLWIDTPQPVQEGNKQQKTLSVPVRLTGLIARAVTVNYVTANGTAIAGKDFKPARGTLTFSPKKPLTQTIKVAILDDKLYENTETFQINLSFPKGKPAVPIAIGMATGTILEGDPMPSLSIRDVSVREGNKGTTKATFVVTLSGKSSLTTTVAYATADGTATVADGDYRAAGSTLTFQPGVTKQTITVLVNGDTQNEASETFQVNLSDPVNAILARPTATGTVRNDDPAPKATRDLARNESLGAATVTAMLSAAGGVPATVESAARDHTTAMLLDDRSRDRLYGGNDHDWLYRVVGNERNDPTAGVIQRKRKTESDPKGTLLDDLAKDVLFGDPEDDWLLDLPDADGSVL